MDSKILLKVAICELFADSNSLAGAADCDSAVDALFECFVHTRPHPKS